jgi:hypothetical protein
MKDYNVVRCFEVTDPQVSLITSTQSDGRPAT